MQDILSTEGYVWGDSRFSLCSAMSISFIEIDIVEAPLQASLLFNSASAIQVSTLLDLNVYHALYFATYMVNKRMNVVHRQSCAFRHPNPFIHMHQVQCFDRFSLSGCMFACTVCINAITPQRGWCIGKSCDTDRRRRHVTSMCRYWG